MRIRLASALAAVLLVPIVTITGTALQTAAPAGADNVTVPLSCLVTNVPVLGSQTANRDQAITTTAVTHVYQNNTYAVAISPAPGNESSDLGSGATLQNIRNLQFRTSVPANSTIVGSPSLSGGSGLNSTPTISLVGSLITVTVPGTINSNTNYQLPTVNMTLRATGTPSA